MDIGDLRTQMRMQQRQRIQHPLFSQPPYRRQHLAGRQTELGFSPPVFCHLPAPIEANRTRIPNCGRTFNRAASSMIASSSDSFSTTIKTLRPISWPIRARRMYSRSFVAVANHHAARRGQAQHRHQFRLAARFQSDPATAVADDFARHPSLLVDLDRIDGGIAATIIQLGDGGGEGPHRVSTRSCRI